MKERVSKKFLESKVKEYIRLQNESTRKDLIDMRKMSEALINLTQIGISIMFPHYDIEERKYHISHMTIKTAECSDYSDLSRKVQELINNKKNISKSR